MSEPSEISPLSAGCRMRCPACGVGPLYDGLLTVRDRCAECGFALGGHDHGDGAQYFVIIFFDTLIMGLALWLELSYEPPVWVHLVIWIPLILVGTVLGLRIMKAILIAYQYHYRKDAFDDDRDA